MGFLKRLASLFTGGSRGGTRMFFIYVLSLRCNEPIAASVDMLSELSQSDEDRTAFFTRKILQGSGKNRCFTQVEVELWFDSNKKLVRHEVSGGRWLSISEYEAELVRFNAPPSEDDVAAEDGQSGGGFG